MTRAVASFLSALSAGVLTLSVLACSSSEEAPDEALGRVQQAVTSCTSDSQCTGAGGFCNTQAGTCTPKLANAQPIPTISGHSPTLDGTCSGPVGVAVCVSTLCDTNNLCGWAAGHSGCNAATEATNSRCQSGICSVSGVCLDPNTCAVDGDCTAGTQYCDTPTKQCKAKLSNGAAIPSIPGHSPTVAGQCTPDAVGVVCASGVCDTDNACGYADGDGTCDATSGPTVCRSGVCAPTGICQSAAGCTTDRMCVAAQFCDTSTNKCTDKIKNGDAIPTIAGHSPDLNGKCSSAAVGASVCAAGFCDVDDKCGLLDTHGPCSDADAAQVCRGGVCTAQNVCLTPSSGGCSGDLQCVSGQFCNSETKACVAKIAGGQPIPTIAGHAPALTGQCTDDAARAVCAAGVCDTADNDCGLADGHGPCTPTNGPVVCRTGLCAGADNTCGPAPAPPPPPVQTGCQFDFQCQPGQFCDNQATTCKARLANGELLPTIPGHDPNLTGVCSAELGRLLCVSGVCDAIDNRCGFRDGLGACDQTNGSIVCRSKVCDATGVCGFVDDGTLQGGGCDTATRAPGSSSPTWLAVIGGLLLASRRRRKKATSVDSR